MWSSWTIFIGCFFLSAFAGLAALLRTEKPLKPVAIISALLNSGFVGLSISLLWYHQYQDNIYFLIGIAIMSGLGGMAFVDVVINLFKNNANLPKSPK